MMRRLDIGAGVLGNGLALGLHSAGYRISAVASRNADSAESLASMIPGCLATQRPQQITEVCDLIFITTPDDVIRDVVRSLHWSPDQAAVHCSGGGSLDILQPAAKLGAACGSFHPFQTFTGLSNPEQAYERMKGIIFAIEAEGWLLETLEGHDRRSEG